MKNNPLYSILLAAESSRKTASILLHISGIVFALSFIGLALPAATSQEHTVSLLDAIFVVILGCSVYISANNKKGNEDNMIFSYCSILKNKAGKEIAEKELFYVLGIENTFMDASNEFIIDHYFLIKRVINSGKIARRISELRKKGTLKQSLNLV